MTLKTEILTVARQIKEKTNLTNRECIFKALEELNLNNELSKIYFMFDLEKLQFITFLAEKMD